MAEKKIALITGANKGLGLEAARQLGALGITVLIGARDEAKGRQAADELKSKGADAHALVIDIADHESIRLAKEQVERRFGRLDVLVNNAAIMVDRSDGPSAGSLEALRDTLETNVVGLVDVTQQFLPLLRKSSAGRIVNLSSILGSLGEHSRPGSSIYGVLTVWYNMSKAAVNMYTVNLAHELKGTKIKVNAAHPGWVKTDMGGPEAPMELVDGAKTTVFLATLPDDGSTGGFFHMKDRLPW